MPGHFHFSPILHQSFIFEKRMKDFNGTEMWKKNRETAIYSVKQWQYLALFVRRSWLLSFYTFLKGNSTVAFRWVFDFCHFNAYMYIGKSAENSVELFLRHPDGGSLWEMETSLSLCVEASPGWHLLEGGCYLLEVDFWGEVFCLFFWKMLTAVPHLKMK